MNAVLDQVNAVPERDRGTLGARVYDRIRDDIVLGVLQPGQKLTLESLMQRYALGMTPLREALYRLSSSLLVTLEDRRGFRVAAISPEHLAEVIHLRGETEALLLRSAFRHADIAWEKRVVAAFHQLQRVADYKPNLGPYTVDWEAAHREFHVALLSAARLPMLEEFHQSVWNHAARYRNLAQAVDVHTDVFTGHEQLMQAALARDEELADVLLRRHVSLATKSLMSRLFPEAA
jgi:GntR family transcriptional regulator, carbon starvation induced regulator